MTPELEALARRAVACRGWRWMQGMKLVDSGRILNVVGSLVEAYESPWIGDWLEYRDPISGPFPDFPDLTDPATLGCLLALVREVYGSPSLYCRLSSTTRASDGIRAWEVLGWLDPSRSPNGRGGSFRGWGYASEAEALVATLEAAP